MSARKSNFEGEARGAGEMTGDGESPSSETSEMKHLHLDIGSVTFNACKCFPRLKHKNCNRLAANRLN